MSRTKQLVKRTVAVVLATSMIAVSGLPVMAAGTMSSYANYAFELESDAATTKPGDFGTVAGNGKVWVDKSVAVASDNSSFDVTLKALCQEYISKDESSILNAPEADVMLILDITGSMKGTGGKDLPNLSNVKTTRMKGMIDATNKAIDVILKANKNNRVGITVFGGNTFSESNMYILPVGTYKLPTDTDGKIIDDEKYLYKVGTKTYGGDTVTTGGPFEGVGKYVELGGSKDDNSNTLKINSNLLNADGTGATAAGRERSSSSTYQQYGVYQGINNLMSSITGERGETDQKKYPYVLLLTDGEINGGTLAFYDAITSSNAKDSTLDSDSHKAEKYCAVEILTSAVMKDKLSAKYTAYNKEEPGETTEATFFTIGVSGAVSGKYWDMLCPSKLEGTGYSLDPKYINDIITNHGDPDYYKYKTTDASKSYIYTTKVDEEHAGTLGQDGYYAYSASDMTNLLKAFTDLGQLVTEKSRLHIIPVTKYDSEDATANITFSDKLGDGMILNGGLKMGTVVGTPTTVGNVTTYKFTGLTSTATYNSSTKTIVWNLVSAELPCIFIDKIISETEMQYDDVNKAPITLSYNVKLDTSVTPLNLSGAYYSNKYTTGQAYASATYKPAGDNPYYYDEVSGSFSPKTSNTNTTNPNGLTAYADSTNTTGTYGYTSMPEWSGNSIMVHLGNNGKETVLCKLEKSASKTTFMIGDTYQYNLKVTNTSSQTLTNVKVSDSVDTSRLENITDISDSGTRSGSVIEWTIPSLAAGASLTLSFKATVKDTVTGNIDNTAKITEINDKTYSTGKEPSSKITTGINPNGEAVVKLLKDDTEYTGETVKIVDTTDATKEHTLTYDPVTKKYKSTDSDPVPPGTYKIIKGTEDTGEQITVEKAKSSEKEIEYYTLDLDFDTGIDKIKVDGSDKTSSFTGIYKKGTSVSIDATLKGSEYAWDKWTSLIDPSDDISTTAGTVNMDGKKSLKATSHVKTGDVEIPIKLDDDSYKDLEIFLIDKTDITKKYPLTFDPVSGTYKATGVPEGSYKVMKGTEEVNDSVDVSDGIKATPPEVKYYSVKLDSDAGFSRVEGEGIYKEGDTVTIKATLKPDYKFSKWADLTGMIGDEGTVTFTIVNIGKHYSYKAASKKIILPAPVPKAADPEEPATEPVAKPKTEKVLDAVPKTNDDFNLTLYLMLMATGFMGAGAGLMLLMKGKKRH